MKITTSIIDYLGKFEDGILVSISLMYNNEFFNSLFYYTIDKMIINTDDSFNEKLGCKIEDHPEYYDILKDLINKVKPYNEIIDKLDTINTE